MDLNTYIKMDATELARLVKNKEVTPTELVEKSFEQLEKVNPRLNAVTSVRKERVLEEALHVQLDGGIFSGVPMLLKNSSQSIKGELMTSGAKLMKDNRSLHDANFVKKLRSSGVLLIGHTNAPEFGLKNITEPELYGATRNPWNEAHSPGGSSGGTASAIAAGIVPIGGASDGGGSIRIPASFTSLFGLKPTRGRTPVGPGVGRQWHGAAIDFVLSKSVRDSAGMLDALQVVQSEAAFQTPLFAGSYRTASKLSFGKPLRVAFSTASPVGTPVSSDARLAVEKTVKWLEDAGHHVEERDNGIDGLQLIKDYYLMNSGEMASLIQRLSRSLGREIKAEDVEIETWMLSEAGKSVSAAAFSESLASWDTAAAQMVDFHQTYDFYLTPATAFTAPKIGELMHSETRKAKLRDELEKASVKDQQAIIYDMFLPSLTYTPFSQLANLTGQPAMSVPVHISEEGLPIGVQVIAPKGDEHRLLQLAAQLETSDLWVGMKGNL